MRVIAGRLGGRRFNSPPGRRTHPMGDKIRGALFNTLGDISGLDVLDAFAGSGALSFEAVSRGASQVVAVESDRKAQQTIAENIKKLNLAARVTVIKASVSAWLSATDQLFDVVIADPPYNDVKLHLLQRLAEHAKPDAVSVFSLPPDAQLILPEARFELLIHKAHGDATLWFYKRKS